MNTRRNRRNRSSFLHDSSACAWELETFEPRMLLSGSAGLASSPSGGAGLDFFVSTSGSDTGDGTQLSPWRHAQFAVDNVPAGATIYLAGGLYNESVRFNASGTVGLPITLSGWNNDTVVLAGDGLDSPFGIDLGSSDHIVIQKMYIRSFSSGGVAADGIVGEGGNDDITLRNLDINHLGTAISIGDLAPTTNHNWTIDSVHIHDNAGSGVITDSGDVDGLLIQNSFFESDSADDTADGISVAGQNISVTNTTIAGFGGDGIAIAGDGVNLRRVTVTGSGVDGIALSGANMLLENSLSVANAGIGLSLTGAGPFTLRFNLIGESDSGVASVWGTTLSPTAVAATGNIFFSTNSAGSLIAIGPTATLSGDTNLYFAPNVSVAPIFWSDHGTFTGDQINSGAWSAASGMDAHSVYADPTLMYNYHPAPGSPAIDRATSGPAIDRDGRARPVGRGFDLGPYEVDADLTPPTVSAVSLHNITAGGGATYDFIVTFTDNAAVRVTSLGDGDVLVTGPGGFSQLATLVNVNLATDGRPRTATYRITAPGGTWDHADDGVYALSLQSNQVADTSGNFALSAQLGSFKVDAFDALGRFGDVDGRRVKKYQMTDADGTLVTFSLSGAGTGVITPSAGGGWDLQLVNTDARTSVKITTKKTATPGDDGVLELVNINSPADIKTLSAKTTNISGDMTFGGTISSLTLGDVIAGPPMLTPQGAIGGQITLSVAGAAVGRQTLSISMGSVWNLSINAPAMPIKSLTVTQWTDTDQDGMRLLDTYWPVMLDTDWPVVPDEITALRVSSVSAKGNKKLNIRGDFSADITATDATAASAIGRITVAGCLDKAEIRSASGISSVTVGGLRDSLIFAGIDPAMTTFDALQTAGVGAFASQTAKLGSLTVKGLPGEALSVIDSSVAAWLLGKVSLRDVLTNNSGAASPPMGVSGHTLSSYTRKVGAVVAASAKKLTGPAAVESVDNFVVQLV